MLRQFHGFGSDWAISLRFVKDEGITLYLVFRYAGDASLNGNQTANAVARIQNALLNREYSFRQVKGQSGISAVDASWAGEAAEITKNEEQYSGDTYGGLLIAYEKPPFPLCIRGHRKENRGQEG